MALYDRFASIYQRGPYLRFSQVLGESVLPAYLNELGCTKGNLLDLACGEGTFAVLMARQGWSVTGIDQSPRMIALAQDRARKADIRASFVVEDMRAIPWERQFHLVTCFFDSLNYLLSIQDLQDAFSGVYRALRPGGYFIFDLNTIYGLAVDWMRQPTYIQNEADDFIEIHRQSFDYENQIATMDITVFLRVDQLWDRVDETHRERGYPLGDIQFLLEEAGFDVVAMVGSLSKRSEVQTTTPRAFFTARKPE